MAQYHKPIVHNSQDMMQELFEEINGYLGDQGKPATETPTQSPFNVSTEDEEDDDSIENNQYTSATSPVDSNNESIKPLSPLQAAMFVESDDDDSYYGGGDNRYEHIEQAVCVCYKCKDDKSGQPINTTEPSTFKHRILHRPKSTSSFSAVSSAKLAHIADLVKQTLTSTPRDIITSANKQTPTYQPPTDNLETASLSAHKYDLDPILSHSYEDTMHSQVNSPSHIVTDNDQYSQYKEDDYGVFSSPINLDSFDGQDSQDSFPCDKQLAVEITSSNQLPFLTPSHRMGEPHAIALRTKMARDVGSHDDRINAYNNAYSHCIMARTDMVPWIKKQYSKGPPDLIQNYTPRPKRSSKALFGLFKRHSKLDDSTSLSVSGGNFDLANASSISSGKSSLMMESMHTVSPRPNKPQQQHDQHYEKNIFSQLLSAPLSNDEESCAPAPVNHIDTSHERRASYQKSNGIHRSPSPVSLIDTSHERRASYQNSSGHHLSPSPVNPVDTSHERRAIHQNSSGHHRSPSPVNPIDTSYERRAIHQKYQGQHRSPSPSYTNSTGKKKSSSFVSVEEPVSILKKSSSTANLKKEPAPSWKATSNYVNSPSTIMKSKSQPLIEDRPVSILKSRSPSPSVSIESRRPRSRSPIPHTVTPNINKRNHLLCPPGSMYPSEQSTRQRSRSVSPSSHRSRSTSPMVSPRSFNEHYEAPPQDDHHQYRHPPHRRTPSPSPSRHYPFQDQYLSPRRHSNGGLGHYRSNSSTVNDFDRKIHRARSSEYLNIAPRSPRGDSSYLLPLEQQHMAPRPRRLSTTSHEYRRPLVSPGRRVTDPPPQRPRSDKRRGMEEPYDDYFSARPKEQRVPKARWSQQQPITPHPLSKRPSHSGLDALDDLCAFFQHLPRHVLANYLQDAQGDFFLAKDLCMEDIMANGI